MAVRSWSRVGWLSRNPARAYSRRKRCANVSLDRLLHHATLRNIRGGVLPAKEQEAGRDLGGTTPGDPRWRPGATDDRGDAARWTREDAGSI